MATNQDALAALAAMGELLIIPVAMPPAKPERVCLDSRHETPCPLPCAACQDECTPQEA